MTASRARDALGITPLLADRAILSAPNTFAPGTRQTFQPTGKLAGSGADGGALEIKGDGTATGGAYAIFHRPNFWATRFGLNESNEFAFGGWSEGVNTQFRFWTEKNFKPSGTFIDAYNECGVRADGTDQSVKIRNAMAKAFLTVRGETGGLGGGTVVLPWGIIDISDTAIVLGYCGLKGQGPTQTTLRMATQDRAVIQVPRDNEFTRVSDIGVTFAGALPGVEQATGFLFQANYGQHTNLHARNTGIAFAIRGGNNNLVTQYFGVSFSLVGFLNEGTTEVQPPQHGSAVPALHVVLTYEDLRTKPFRHASDLEYDRGIVEVRRVWVGRKELIAEPAEPAGTRQPCQAHDQSSPGQGRRSGWTCRGVRDANRRLPQDFLSDVAAQREARERELRRRRFEKRNMAGDQLSTFSRSCGKLGREKEAGACTVGFR